MTNLLENKLKRWTNSSGQRNLLHIISLCEQHNCGYWDDENPNLTLETQLNKSGVTVCGTLSTKGFIGPVFFFLWKCEWRKLFGNASSNGSATTPYQLNFYVLFFQQDGASPHLPPQVKS